LKALPGRSQTWVGSLVSFFVEMMNEPQPVRRLIRALIRKARLGSPQFRWSIGAVDRPHYAYLVYMAARLAASLGKTRVSILEFGVAGGAGLLAMEAHAAWVEQLFPVKIEIYGFDSGVGLPAPVDYRDLPYHWRRGFFEMDIEKLRGKLARSRLVLGDVAGTAREFFVENPDAAPIGAISFDLDFYTSTRDAFRLLDAPDEHFLPRIYSYFDDVVGRDECYADGTGERLAIREFNAQNAAQEFSPDYYLRSELGFMAWHHKIWVLHKFAHSEYCQFVGAEGQQLPV
jgi:hypothetical protein